jgi:hypothetical protein
MASGSTGPTAAIGARPGQAAPTRIRSRRGVAHLCHGEPDTGGSGRTNSARWATQPPRAVTNVAPAIAAAVKQGELIHVGLVPELGDGAVPPRIAGQDRPMAPQIGATTMLPPHAGRGRVAQGCLTRARRKREPGAAGLAVVECAWFANLERARLAATRRSGRPALDVAGTVTGSLVSRPA